MKLIWIWMKKNPGIFSLFIHLIHNDDIFTSWIVQKNNYYLILIILIHWWWVKFFSDKTSSSCLVNGEMRETHRTNNSWPNKNHFANKRKTVYHLRAFSLSKNSERTNKLQAASLFSSISSSIQRVLFNYGNIKQCNNS